MDITLLATSTAFLAATIRMATPIALAGLGETISEKSGVINIGVEAIMLSGAFFSFLGMFSTGSVLLGLLFGMLGGVGASMLHAFLSIRCKANQTIAGLALNFLLLGLTSFLFLMKFGQTTTLPSITVIPTVKIPLLSRLPLLGESLFNQDPFVYLLLFLVLAIGILFYKTEWGVILHAVGENPRAADTAGISVNKVRYLACFANGILGGLGGTYLSMVKLGFFMENLTAGKGYIALVTVILGRRNPLGVIGAALVIGSAEALQIRLQTMGTSIPSQAFSMLPYVVTVIVLLFSIGRNQDPTALGIPYERDKR
ncbi:putative ABC-type transport system, permease component [Sphaerochaeta pleomorpha str. Grapes]|uniref:Putative ABC-type transport system, permease component n=1 Tax=Sphaerochaeta pleomorpha (strain ATCC BAA-1885 / DSM 22778 / Grapes) TaxID=158190 RepID=G8QSI6_SPHPG|nr:ABC transporter permease [Sphaerochaeta pleomorpha]AEV27885.1 putative ABC-type transport system, permease component [Sphaerochaeta pleomorpha str. Grapes]